MRHRGKSGEMKTYRTLKDSGMLIKPMFCYFLPVGFMGDRSGNAEQSSLI